MAKVYVTCCSRCGAAHDDKAWVPDSAGRRVHYCPDGIAGSEGEFDEMKPETRPKLPTPPVSKKALDHAGSGAVLPDPATVIWEVPLGNGTNLEITDHMLYKRLVRNEMDGATTMESGRAKRVVDQCREYVACAIEGGDAMVGYSTKINKAINGICDEHAEKAFENAIKSKFMSTSVRTDWKNGAAVAPGTIIKIDKLPF